MFDFQVVSSTKTSLLASGSAFKSVMPQSAAGLLDVLGLPFYGPKDGRDSSGQYFDERTDFLQDEIPFPPVFYYHGSRSRSRPIKIGKVVGRWKSELGVWFQVLLDMTLPESQRVWQAAQDGHAYASTGAVPASIDLDKETGWIKQWLVGEVSLIDESPTEGRRPANYYAIAKPSKDVWLKTMDPSTLSSLTSRFGDCFKGDFPLEEDRDDEEIPMTVKAMFNGVEMTPSEKCASCYEHNGVVRKKLAEGDAGWTKACADCSDAAKCGDCFKAMPTCDCEGCQKAGECPCGPECKCNKSEKTVDVKTVTPVAEKVVEIKTVIDTSKVNELEQTINSLKMDLSARESAAWVKDQVQSGRVAPSEEPRLQELLGLAYQADATMKTEAGLLKAVKAFVEARPVTGRMSTDVRVITGVPSGDPSQSVDVEYMKRMKSFT